MPMTLRTDDVFYAAAIIISPTLYLADLSLTYALVPWVCAGHPMAVLHAVSAIGLLLIVAPLAIGWRSVRARSSALVPRARLLTAVAIGSTLLFGFAMILQWFTQFVIGPCTT